VTTIEERLQRLEDRDAIHQLFVDYGRHLDAGDLESYVSVFARDGEVLLGPMGRAKGHDEIRALMGRVLARAGGSFHIISSPAVELDGDRATSQVMWTVISKDENGKPRLTMLGRHLDDLVREDGAWRISRRRGHIDLPAAMEV
jgi:uncharacterized protein (TIGR02246 family)